ncbi:MAG: hypothetical protein IKL39_04010, partial [Mailhella sp.]|nr:hypothetical protein [Mailhella sp.]
MPKVLSPTSQFLRYVIVAVILILQVASLIVAFNLNSAIISRTDNYATEASRLASTVIGNRIASVRQVLGKVAEDISDKLAQGVPDEEIHRIISEYKQLWNYSEARLLKYEGGIAQDDFSTLAGRERQLIERAATEKRIVMGQSSKETCITYAVP